MAARLYVMVGIPGCGKTTYARRYLGHALRVSLDDLRLMMTGRAYDERAEPMVVVAAHALLAALLARANAWRQDVLLDATNATHDVRQGYVRLARSHQVSPVAVYVECDLATALARDAARSDAVGGEVVRRFHSRLRPPTLAEGFDEVISVET